ncbi:conserved hypothetical protein [Candida dubliniensis CD36]|uniref:Uncharacterized protein n=1 Tax=Candida dubliniensis (strain CD36 / ATCC MYA-646 / CBS 7987 / NCPF 3949 / NRRL Y-17841) TaxID=573826 RepID=B9W754_CANDC|nr:conserved hypothetical protein [Candida dubliniensis CD36]CAX44513.1 conserved hypothetical protein [Candida dubliniensis CD36]
MIHQTSSMTTTAVFEEISTEFDNSLMELLYSTTSEDALPDMIENSPTTITIVAIEIPSLFSYSTNEFDSELDYESSDWGDITEPLPQNIPKDESEPITKNPTNVLTSPLQAFADFNSGSSTEFVTKQQKFFNYNNTINRSFKNNDYTTNKATTTPKCRISKPCEKSPLMKPSVTIASIDTIAKLKSKSKNNYKSSSISKTKVGNPFYKPFISSSSIPSKTAMKNAKVVNFRDVNNNTNNTSLNFTDIDNKLTYDLLTETTNCSVPQTVLETQFKNFDDSLIFDSFFDINQI